MRAFDLIKLQCYALENHCRFSCRELSLEDFAWRPASGSPAIGWNLGHILLSHDYTVNYRFLDNALILSDDYQSNFGFQSAGEFPGSYDPNVMLDKFKKINEKILASLSTKEDVWLLENAPESEKFPPHMRGKPYAKCFVMHFSHVFTHIGQILEIRRILGKGGWGF
ncbi:MAG: DinB family protein [Candidatus Hodarchaeota archaeon]